MNDPIKITRFQNAAENGYDRVLAFLRDQLLSGRLKTGDRLLSERDLAAALGVSRPVIREALRALAAIGAVEIQRGYGTVVREPDFTALAEYFSFVLAQQTDVIDDILQARIAIERHAIRLACERAKDSDIEKIARAFDKIVQTMDDPAQGGQADFNFHAMIVEAAHSPTLKSVYSAIAKLLHHSHLARRQRIANTPGIEEYLIGHHGAILEAVRARDAVRAEALLIEHFAIGADLRKKAEVNLAKASPKPAPSKPKKTPAA